MNVIERIQESYNTLTAAEQEAATYILSHLTDVLISNSAELSQLSGISQPTLSRLYRKLGYQNASEFKHDIRRYHEPGAPEIAHINTSAENPVQDQMLRDIESLQHTYSRISTEQLQAIATAIADAEQVAVVGLRNNYPMALHLREQLIQSRPRVNVLPQPGQSLAEEIVDLGPSDLAILFGARRRTAAFAAIVDALYIAHVPMIIIGDSTIRRLAQAHEAIFVEVDLNVRILSSYTSAFSVVALIADAVAAQGQQVSHADTAAIGSTSSTNRIEQINQRFAELEELERSSSRK